MKVDFLFPWVVQTYKMSEEEFKRIRSEIENKFNIINSLLTSETWGDNVHTTNSTRSKCIITELGFRNLEKIIEPLVKSYLKNIDVKYHSFRLNGSWINITTPGGFQGLHIHQHDTVSGCIYLDVPEGSGGITFQPSFLEDFKQNRSYKVQNGDIMLFHGLLPHKVSFNKSKLNRISLSFNYFYDMVL